jgi:rubrerythrin
MWCLELEAPGHVRDVNGKCIKEKQVLCMKCNSKDHNTWKCPRDADVDRKAFLHKKESYLAAVLNKQPTKQRLLKYQSTIKGRVEENRTLKMMIELTNTFVKLLIDSGIVEADKVEALKEVGTQAMKSVGTTPVTPRRDVNENDRRRIVDGADGKVQIMKRSVADVASVQIASDGDASSSKQVAKKKKSKNEKKNESLVDTPSNAEKKVCVRCGRRYHAKGASTHSSSCKGLEGIEYDVKKSLWICAVNNCI